ncbi:hypothetical protein KUCAC02_029519 [Chaenocephalus aceratus]|nr:hypothetical protein KUCAC02_029519 [Chaenocephalus aceratus]
MTSWLQLKDKVGYIKSRLVSGQIVPRSDLTAYRSYCVTALLIRHKLSKEAVVEFQVHDWLHRTTGSDGTTIRLTSSKAAGHTFTLSRKRDEAPQKEEPASLPTPPVTVGIQWDRFLEAFPVSLHSVAPSKRLCVGAGFTAYRPLYRKWRNVQLLERTSYILSMPHNPPRRRCDGPSPRSAGLATPPSVQDVVRGRVAPLGAPTSSQSLIRSISEQSWRGLAVRDFGGRRAKVSATAYIV